MQYETFCILAIMIIKLVACLVSRIDFVHGVCVHVIDFVHSVYAFVHMCVYVRMCLCPFPRLVITSGMIWHSMDPI